MRHRFSARSGVTLGALLLVVTACGGGAKVKNEASSNTTAPPGSTAPEACKTATLTSPEIGVTDKTITVTTIADVGSPIRPGLFLGSFNAVKAWADYMNANGGLACRKVVVKTVDSQLNPDNSRNGVSTACGDSVALVGTTALFLQDVSGLVGCKDKAGKATGLPDIAELQTEPAHQCAAVSFVTLPGGASCPYSGSGPRTYRVGYTTYDYYFNKYGKDLHGVFVVPKDLPSTISATMPLFRAENMMGIASDKEFGKSGLDTQTAYTEVAAAMK